MSDLSSGSASASLNQATVSKPIRPPKAITRNRSPASSLNCAAAVWAWRSIRVNIWYGSRPTSAANMQKTNELVADDGEQQVAVGPPRFVVVDGPQSELGLERAEASPPAARAGETYHDRPGPDRRLDAWCVAASLLQRVLRQEDSLVLRYADSMARPRGRSKPARLTVNLDQPTYVSLKVARREDVSVSWVVRRAIETLRTQDRANPAGPSLASNPDEARAASSDGMRRQ